MQRHEVWALVMDGSTARIVIDVTRPEHMAPDPGEILLETAHLQKRDFAVANQGQISAPLVHENAAEYRFAIDVVRSLTASYNAGLFERLVVIAGPEMLGILRATLTDDLRACVLAEISKQMTAIDRHDLRVAIAHWVARPRQD